jgi:ABC-2 type transport system ATP-binding protein
LTGQLQPSVGELRVFGQPVWNNPEVLRRMGYCPEHDGAWDEMSGFEFVEALGRFSGLDKAGAEKAAQRAIGAVGMTESAGRRLGTYSKGMRQRIKLAQAIAADPDLLVLDEPLTGCDPVARASIIQLIQGLGRAGKTVLVSSHVLHEVESMTEEILLIHRGQLLAQGKVHALRDLIDEHPHRIRVICDRPRELAARLATHESVRSVTMENETLTVETPQSDRCYPEVSRAALELKVKVSEITSPDDNLEAVFRYLTSVRFGKNRHD